VSDVIMQTRLLQGCCDYGKHAGTTI